MLAVLCVIPHVIKTSSPSNKHIFFFQIQQLHVHIFPQILFREPTEASAAFHSYIHTDVLYFFLSQTSWSNMFSAGGDQTLSGLQLQFENHEMWWTARREQNNVHVTCWKSETQTNVYWMMCHTIDTHNRAAKLYVAC